MPRVLEANGFVIYIYPNDHLPMHVHIFRGSPTGPEMEVNLEDGSEIENHMNDSDSRRARRLVAAHRKFLMSEWRRIDPKLNQF